MQSTQIRNRPPAVPVRVNPPAGWQELFVDKPLLEALSTYTRLNEERVARGRAARELERDLTNASVRDRDGLAKAIGEGTALPASDKHARKASDALAEALRLRDATIEAHARSSYVVERIIGERKDAVIGDLEGRIIKAMAEAEAAVVKLDSALDSLISLRRARQFVQTKGRRSNWVHPFAPAWAGVHEQVRQIISEPARESAPDNTTVSDDEAEES